MKVFCQTMPTLVSLRSLVEVGLGRKPWLSSIRDAMSLHDFSPLRERLPVEAEDYSPREKGILRMALFLHRELPVRYARGVDQLDGLPIMQGLQAVREVRQWYAESFQDIRNSPRPETKECEREFVRTLMQVRDRHAEELWAMAKGIYELRTRLREIGEPICDDIHAYLDRFYLKRIGLRLLIGHYLALHERPTEDYVGVVCMRSKVREIVQTAAEDARWICREKYGAAPEIMIIGGEKLTFCHVPAHLHYMVMELLKNALQAVCQKHGARDDAPPVTVMLERDYSLTDGQQVVIRIEDRGGGIPSEDFENIWCYLYTTADPGVQAAMIGAQRSRGQRGLPLAGLGYGLPLSRLYAQHFGGNLELHNTPGEGLEAELRLNRLGDKKEPLV